MTFARWVAGLFHPPPVEDCPACGGAAARHELRTLACERFASGTSGIEGLLARDDFPGAAALHDSRVLGDALVHELLRCGERVALITVEAALLLGAKVRSIRILDGQRAASAWAAAR
jgi:hypothetical protein